MDCLENVDVHIFNSLPHNSIVVDVRPELEFSMYNLPNTINIPYTDLNKNEVVDRLRKEISMKGGENVNGEFCFFVFVIVF